MEKAEKQYAVSAKELHENAKAAGVDTSHSPQKVLDEWQAFGEKLRGTVLPSVNGKAQSNGHVEADPLTTMHEQMTATAPSRNGSWTGSKKLTGIAKGAEKTVRVQAQQKPDMKDGRLTPEEIAQAEARRREKKQSGGLRGATQAAPAFNEELARQADEAKANALLEEIYAEEIKGGGLVAEGKAAEEAEVVSRYKEVADEIDAAKKPEEFDLADTDKRFKSVRRELTKSN